MKKITIVLTTILLLLALPAFAAVGPTPAKPQAITNDTPLNSDTAQLEGTLNATNLPLSNGFDGAFSPTLVLTPRDTKQTSSTAPAAPVGFSLINVPSGSSYINVAKSIEGTPGYNPNPCVCAPSDMGLGASSQYVVQMVNLAGTIYNTGGTIVKPTFQLADFWFLPNLGGPLKIGMSDPQVIFDARAQRWFASILDTYHVNRIRIAVSANANPLGTWYIYSVRAPSLNCTSSPATNPQPNCLPDQPWIGYSDDKFLIAANDFAFDPTFTAGAYVGAEYWILNKAQMMAGAFSVNLQTNSPSSSDYRIDPMQQLSSGTTAYMVENCLTLTPVVLTNDCPATFTTTDGGINVFTVTGLPPTATVTMTTVAIAQTGFPNPADQPGHPATLNTNDNRIVGAVYNNGKIWTALNDGNNGGPCPLPSCVRLDEIATPVLPGAVALQDFDFTSNGAATFYGSVSTDTSNNLVVMFETSSSTVYPSLLVTGQLATAAPNTLAPSRTVQAGSASDLSTRWGDYYYATTQPGATSTFWVSGGYRTIELFQGWQTRIGKITFATGSSSSGSCTSTRSTDCD
jgi:hypothetical protein